MITEHIMAPAFAEYRRREWRACLMAIGVMVAALLWFLIGQAGRKRQLAANLKRLELERMAVAGAGELEAFIDAIAGDRGRCTCDTSKPCGERRCILCRGCGKVVSLIRRPDAFKPDSPERAALLQRQRDAIAGNQPFTGGPL